MDARALTKTGGNHIKTCISNPSGNLTDAVIRDLGDGTYQVEYTPYEEGEFRFSFLLFLQVPLSWSSNAQTLIIKINLIVLI